MHLRRLAPLLCAIALMLTACTPLDLLGLAPVPSESGKLVPAAPAPGEAEDAQGRTVRDVAVFYTEHEPGYADSATVLAWQHDKMSSVIGFWYRVNPDTFVVDAVHPKDVIAASKEAAEAYGLKTEMLVYNFLYGSSAKSARVLERLMTDPKAQRTFIDSLVSVALREGYTGVSIDFEHLRPAQRDAFSQLIEAIAEAVHAHGLTLSISVGAKTWDDPANGWAGGYDYRRLGEAVDRMVIMTYDEHGYTSGPGPIASLPWVEAVVKYAVTQVPPEKLMLGIAGYGFDWSRTGGSPRYLSYAQAAALRQKAGVALRWDDRANTPYFIYTDAQGRVHEVWFEDASSTSWKLDLVDKYNLRGIALWRLGLEDPAVWDVVADKFVPMR